MPKIIQRGKKDVKYVECGNCGSYLSFYHSETQEEVYAIIEGNHSQRIVRSKITCPACGKSIVVARSGIWEEGVVSA